MEGFEIVELGPKVTDTEMSELIDVIEKSLVGEIVVQLRVAGMSTAERREWFRRFWLSDTLQDPAHRLFAIRDTNTSVLIAYAGLQVPYKPSDAEAAEQRKHQEAKITAQKPRARDWQLLFNTQVGSVPSKFGYDPTKHFHRRNTLMLPEYHRRGLGTWLTGYCNDVADKVSQPTYVMARPKAWKMLEVTGFEVLQTVNIDAKEYGITEDVTVKVYKRSPR